MSFRSIFQQKSSVVQFTLFFVIVFVCGLLFSLISYVMLPFLFEVSFLNLESFLSDYSNQKTVNALKFLQLFSSIGLFIVPPFLFSYLTNFNFKFNQLNRQMILLSIGIMILANPLISFLYQLNQGVVLPESFKIIEQWMKMSENKAKEITELFLIMSNSKDLVINILIIAIIPALGEELLFRGVLQQLFAKWTGRIHLSIFVSAFLFSAIHFQFYGFLPRFILGLILGYMFYWSGSLWLPILAHFTNNALAVFFSYHLVADKVNIDFLKEEIPVSINQGLISLFAISLLLYLLKKSAKIKKT